MKHKILFLLVAFLFLGISFSACNLIIGNTDSNQNNSSVICPQYFWGTWTRMDNGTVYEIGESEVNVVSTGSTTATYKISAKTDSSFRCSLGTFKKDTDNVLKIGSIPVFRNGGSNIEYSVSLVGFSDTLSRAATASSTASALSGISATATNEDYPSYSESSTSDSNGTVTLHSPVADTPNTITVSASDGTTVTATVTPKNAGENAGTIAVATSGRYSLKVSGEITTDTSEDDGYLYAGKTYDMTVTVTNTTDVVARPGNITITSSDSRITVFGETQNEIASFKSPSTKQFSVQVTCSSLKVPYLDSGLNVQFEDADGYVWNDFIPLKIFKETELIQVYAKGVENDDCSLNGFVMYPDGKSKYFSVPSGETSEIEVPSFPATEPYKLAFSGAALGATVQQSTEMKYSVGVNTSAIQNFSAYKLSEIVNLYEPNNSEDKAVQIDSSRAVVAYLETDDIDFYSVAVNFYGLVYTITYELDGGTNAITNPTSYTVESSTITLSDATRTESYYEFGGWYTDSDFENQITKIPKGSVGNIMLYAKWEFLSSQLSSQLSSLTSSDQVTYIIDTKITQEDIEEIAEAIKETSGFVSLDFSNATGIDTLEVGVFNNCTNLTSITIPDSVTSIGDCAFSACTSLTSITIPDSVTSIGDCAFSVCTSLTSITILDSVTSIGDSAFSGCTSLTSITIPDSVTSIGDRAFYDCTSLTSITIPNSVMRIGSYAFESCTSLTSITIPDSVMRIGSYAFESCTNLTSITIPDSVTSIGDRAFCDCTSLTSITIPDSVTSIEIYAFSGCTNLTSITIPNSVTSIGKWAFYDCANLISITVTIGNSVYDSRDNCNAIIETSSNSLIIGCKNSVIPNSVTSIGSYAFCNCTSLTSITIPDSVTSIGDRAFCYCTSLTSITIPNSVTSIGYAAFEDCTSLTSITIPNSVTRIGSYAFEGCRSLTNITIPNSVTSIGVAAFWCCTNLTSAKFSTTNGWYYASTSVAESGTTISSTDLSDTSTAATYLKSTYCWYYWYRK